MKNNRAVILSGTNKLVILSGVDRESINVVEGSAVAFFADQITDVKNIIIR